MPKRYSIADARSNLPLLVNEAAAGADIELTRRGKSVAVIVSPQSLARLRGDQPGFGNAYRRFLERYPLEHAALPKGFFKRARVSDRGRKVLL